MAFKNADTKIVAVMILDRETKGALRYQEVDDKGNPLKQDSAVIGTLYVRKAKMAGPPRGLKITLESVA